MGFQLSITYIQSGFSAEALYEAVIAAFKSEIENNLFCLDYTNFTTYKKCGPLTTERFLGPARAAFVTESILSSYNRGVVIYPKRNGLFTIVDSLIHEADIIQANRTHLPELYAVLQRKPEAIEYIDLQAYMNFLLELSRILRAEDRKSTRLNSSHSRASRMPSSA